MPARFRIFDSGPDKGSDRYFVVDSKPFTTSREHRGPHRSALSMNRMPYHPQMGVGQHVELDAESWYGNAAKRVRNWGVRVKLDDLTPDAAYSAVDFIAECLDEGSDDRKALSEFLKTNHSGSGWSPGTPTLVANAHKDPRVSRVLEQVLAPVEVAVG